MYRRQQGLALNPAAGGRGGGGVSDGGGAGGAAGAGGGLWLRAPGVCQPGQEGEVLGVPGQGGAGGDQGGQDAGYTDGLKLLAWG